MRPVGRHVGCLSGRGGSGTGAAAEGLPIAELECLFSIMNARSVDVKGRTLRVPVAAYRLAAPPRRRVAAPQLTSPPRRPTEDVERDPHTPEHSVPVDQFSRGSDTPND